MTYGDSALWPARADGVGGTLQLIDPELTPASQYSKSYRWRGSTEIGGSPGTAGQAVIPVVVNEILSHTDPPVTDPDSIELLNVGSSAINIGGWYLSDSATRLFKYRIPDDVVLQPGQYVVFDETDFNPTPLDPAPLDFSLNGAEGDDVWLTIADGEGKLLFFVDDVHFPATANGESLGRVPNGQGRLAPLQRVSLGSENAAPRVGPVIVSEIQYRPDEPSDEALAQAPEMTVDDLEFVEITNPTAQPINLTRVADPGRDRLRICRWDCAVGRSIPGRCLLRSRGSRSGESAGGLPHPLRTIRLGHAAGSIPRQAGGR